MPLEFFLAADLLAVSSAFRYLCDITSLRNHSVIEQRERARKRYDMELQ